MMWYLNNLYEKKKKRKVSQQTLIACSQGKAHLIPLHVLLSELKYASQHTEYREAFETLNAALYVLSGYRVTQMEGQNGKFDSKQAAFVV